MTADHAAVLAALAKVAATADDMDEVAARLVEQARRADPPATWAEIGAVLGITRQAAHYRYGRTTTEEVKT